MTILGSTRLRNAIGTACLMLVVFLTTGCGSSNNNTIHVSGVVKYKGAPVPRATVTFLPATPGQGTSEFATTDASGNYVIKGGTEKRGLLPGSYKVSIQALKVPINEIPPPDLAKREESNRAVPKKYFSDQTSELTATITKDQKSAKIDFNLED